MRHKSTFAFVLAAAFVAMAPLGAQAQDEQRVHFTFGAGWTAPNSEVRDHLGDGYNFNFGIDVAVNPTVSIEGLYSFNGLGEKQLSIPVASNPIANPVNTDFFASMNMQYGTGSVIVQRPEGGVRPFGLVGMGVYYRPIEVTTPAVGFAPGYCDPWLYVCYPGGWVEVDKIIGERSSTDFGMVFGGGARFGPVYAELRYHYIWGPTVESLPTVQPLQTAFTGEEFVGKKANGQFFVTTFGVRF
jgi:Outer membrane protein beta-barrel domain